MQPPDMGLELESCQAELVTHPPVLLVPKPEAGKSTPLPNSATAGKQVVLGAHRDQRQVLPVMAWLPSPSL